MNATTYLILFVIPFAVTYIREFKTAYGNRGNWESTARGKSFFSRRHSSGSHRGSSLSHKLFVREPLLCHCSAVAKTANFCVALSIGLSLQQKLSAHITPSHEKTFPPPSLSLSLLFFSTRETLHVSKKGLPSFQSAEPTLLHSYISQSIQ